MIPNRKLPLTLMERIPYRDACVVRGPDYFDYRNYSPDWG